MRGTSLRETRPNRWLPRTRPGSWSVGLLGVSLISFAAFFGLAASGQEGGDSFLDNLWLSGTMLSAAGCAIAAGFAGAWAAIRELERSPGVILAMLLGLLVLVFVVGEVVAPH